MSTERIKDLHEQASDRYLLGDYSGAIEAWREVLSLDPADEQANGGVRMASQFVETGPPAPTPAPERASASSEVEHELDRGLMVLDGVEAQEDDPALGASEIDDILEGWELQANSAPQTAEYGLEPVARAASAPATPASAAAAELKRRVEDLLAEAKAKAEVGEREDALAILSRLAILDEDNAEADVLRAGIESGSAAELDEIERAIIEGVAAMEADRLDEAERMFRNVLARAPEHREAKHYLEKLAERRALGHEDLLAAVEGESEPSEDAAQRAISDDLVPPQLAIEPKAPRKAAADHEPREAPLAVRRPRFPLPSQKILILAGVTVVVVAGAGIALSGFFRKPAPEAPTPAKAGSVVWHRRGVAPSGASPAKGSAPAPAVPATPEERANAVASGLAAGRSRLAAGDFAGAVISFNDALTLDPGNETAMVGITEAGDRYKAIKAERDAFASIRLAFRDGEFTSGLRLAYRLPETVDKTYSDAIKVAGWYNLAVVALRAGDCREAMSHLDEALQLAPSDGEAKKLRDFASRYANAVKDRPFLNRVEAQAFRPVPAS